MAEWIKVYCPECSNETKVTKGQEAWCSRTISHARNKSRLMKPRRKGE